MNYIRKIISIMIIFSLTIGGFLIPNNVYAMTSKVDTILSQMSNEDKIAQMIMPSFRKQPGVNINEDNIKDIISTYNFAGVILYAENTPDIESTIRFVDLLQNANKNNYSRLLISIDQEGGYVTRLGIGTKMPGNMALTATNNSNYAYNSAKIIGSELKVLGINTNFAPVVDVNSNPSNPVIGIRSFSDDANTVATYSEKFMQGLQSEGIITSLKHFPGHGDTKTDTHTGLAIINKTYDELKQSELIPFQKLINSGTDMIMTAHIEFPNIETDTYVSKKDGNTYTLPATLSKKILTDILRNDMGYNGIIVTDALDMAAISSQFGIEDASIRAINAGVDILLMPYTYDSQINEFKAYIQSLASKIGTEINEDNVNASVRRILKLKEEKGLLEEYDNPNLEEKITNAKNIVSSKENHNEEFEIAKKSITMIKNDDNVLPINSEDKTVILYEYGSHIEAVNNAIRLLKKDGNDINEENISVYPFYKNNQLPLDEVKEAVKDAKNVVMIRSSYGNADLKDPDVDKMNELIDYVHEKGGKVIAMSTQLPYDIVKFKNADALVLTYFANGIWINLDDYEKELPSYGPNVMAGIYMLFTQKDNMNGVLPVNIYNLDDNNNYTNELLYQRGFGLKYLNNANVDELNKNKNQAKEIINSDKEYTSDSLNVLKEIYNKVLKYQDDNPELLEDKQNEIDNLVLELQNAINNLKAIYKILDGNNQEYEKGKDISIRANGNLEDLVMLMVDNNKLDSSNYKLEKGSTIAILNANYLNTLDAGDHTLTFVYNDGKVDATFTISKASTVDNIQTGDNIIKYIMLLILSIISLIGIISNKKKLFN